jgi:hypothetical protein
MSSIRWDGQRQGSRERAATAGIIMSSIIMDLFTLRSLRTIISLGLSTWIVSSLAVRAQDTFGARDTLVAKINQQIALLKGSSDDSVVVLKSDVGSLSLSGLSGECLVIDSTNVIVIRRVGSDFVLEIQTAPATTMNIPAGAHKMVCDLETAWLKRSWGFTMSEKIADHRIAKDGVSSCYSSLRFSQNFMTDGIDDIRSKPMMLDTLKFWLEDWSADTTGRQYRVVTDSLLNEGNRTGVTIYPLGIPDDNFFYIAKRRALADSDVADGKMAFTSVEFYPYPPTSMTAPPLNTAKIVQKVSIEAHLRSYRPADCSSSLPGWFTHALPDPDSAYVLITYMVHDNATNTTTPQYLWRTYAAPYVSNADIDSSNDSLWTLFDPNVQFVLDNWCVFDIDNDGYLTFTAKLGGDHECTLPGTFRIMRLRSNLVPAQVCQFLFAPTDTFQLDRMTGEVFCNHVGDSGPDALELVPCLDFCKKISGYRTIDNVIAASAQRFDNGVPYDTSGFLTGKALGTWPQSNTSNNIYEIGEGRWRPIEGYAYRTGTKTGGKLADVNERVYKNAGIFVDDTGGTTGAFRLFDWRNPDANAGTKWLLASTATQYSPFGEPLEERDILGIYSAARFSHKNTVTRLVAKNAQYRSVGYESFEDGKGSTNSTAHSGKWSYRLASSYPDTGVLRLTVTEQMKAKKVLVRLWVRQTYTKDDGSSPPFAMSGFGSGSATKIAQTGEWSLYEQVCDVSSIDTGTVIDLKLKSLLSDDPVWADDIRAQPFDAEMTCYAYDSATLRLVTQFDDQHFGVFYQYNGEGKLVRTLRETERGIMTVEERQYHVPDMYARATGAPASIIRMGGGSPFSGASIGDPDAMRAERDGEGLHREGSNRFDLLDLSVDGGGVHGKVLGGPPDPNRLNLDSLRAMLGAQIDRLSPSQIAQLDALGLKDVEKIKDLMEVREIERRMRELEERGKGQLGDEERHAVESAWEELKESRGKIMRERLGVDENELRELYKTLDESQQNDTGGAR